MSKCPSCCLQIQLNRALLCACCVPTVVHRSAFAATAGHLFTLNKDEFRCYWKLLVCVGFLSSLVVFVSLRQVTEGLWKLTKNDLWNRIPDILSGESDLGPPYRGRDWSMKKWKSLAKAIRDSGALAQENWFSQSSCFFPIYFSLLHPASLLLTVRKFGLNVVALLLLCPVSLSRNDSLIPPTA